MIRFRYREDERRYLQLVAEVYRLIAANLPPAQVSTAMRNLGKLQDLLMLEGVRQGVAAAAVSNLSQKTRNGYSLEHLKAFQLHAHVYGSQDTPLRDIEIEWVNERLGASPDEADEPWLDPNPMRFAPDTEQAFLRASGKDVAREEPPSTAPTSEPEWPLTDDSPGDVSFDIDTFLAEQESSGEAQEQPQLLDRIRDTLMELASSGARPRDWQDMILRLHLALHVDAGFIDLQLGTPMGRTVLAQAGYQDIIPGPFGTDLNAIEQAVQEVSPAQVAEVAPSPGASAPNDDSSPEDD